MALDDLVAGLIGAFVSWRFYLCLLLGVALAGAIFHFFGNTPFAWCGAVPVFISGLLLGFFWELRSEVRRK